MCSKDSRMCSNTVSRQSFGRTLKELEALESFLICKMCHQMLNLPTSTCFCDHMFCKECADKLMGKTCPFCMAPMNDQTTQVDQQLSTLIFLTSKLKQNLTLEGGSSQGTKEEEKEVLGEKLEPTSNNSTPEGLGSTMRKDDDHINSILQTPRSRAKRNAKGETPLHLAAIKGDYKTAEELLLEGCSPNLKDNAGWSPLHEACNHGHTRVVTLLLKHGALVNLPGWDNATPLHDAVANNRHDVVKVLLENGAAVAMRDRRGATSLDLAPTEEMRELLRSHTDGACSITPSTVLTEERQICVVTTGLDSEQKLMTEKLMELLGGVMMSEITDQVTHVVALCSTWRHCPRTLKYLHGVLKGLWIVDFRWVEQSLQVGGKASEAEFEVTGAGFQSSCNGPSRARGNAEGQYPPLFDGCHFFFSGSFSNPHPSRDRLSELAKMGGGVLLNREPRSQSIGDERISVPYHAPPLSPLSKCTYFVVTCERKFAVKNNICRASVDWFLDCIGAFQLLVPADGE